MNDAALCEVFVFCCSVQCSTQWSLRSESVWAKIKMFFFTKKPKRTVLYSTSYNSSSPQRLPLSIQVKPAVIQDMWNQYVERRTSSGKGMCVSVIGSLFIFKLHCGYCIMIKKCILIILIKSNRHSPWLVWSITSLCMI